MAEMTAKRLPEIPETELTPPQREAIDALVNTPRGASAKGGPFLPMLYSPELLNRAQHLGEYLRYHGAIPAKLREFAILITARHWKARYEWYIHAPIAIKEGLNQAIVQALAEDRKPPAMNSEETAIYHFCTQVHRYTQVDDHTYAAAQSLLGDKGIVDLCGVCGYYSMLAMLMNVAETTLPEGAEVPF